MHHKQFTNPAAMGAEDAFNFATYAQSRLYGFDSAPVQAALQVTIPFATGTAGYDFSNDKNMYIGFTAFVESIGVHLNYNILASYAYKINLNSNTNLTFALALGVDVNSVNYQKLLHDYDTDPVVTTMSLPAEYKLHGQTGTYLQGNKFYVSLYSSSIVSNQNIYLQAGLFTTVGKSDDDGYSIQNANRKSMFEINGQLGYTNSRYNTETMLQAQVNTIFTMNNFIGVGAAWEYPLKVAGIATFNLGSVKISYCYYMDNLDKNLPTHEVLLRIKITPKHNDIF
jgi:type IX secretion system PorP/SprF family membrane protein